MTKDIPAGSGQLDPETSAKLEMLRTQAEQAVIFGKNYKGERLKDFALDEVERVLGLIREVISNA